MSIDFTTFHRIISNTIFVLNFVLQICTRNPYSVFSQHILQRISVKFIHASCQRGAVLGGWHLIWHSAFSCWECSCIVLTSRRRPQHQSVGAANWVLHKKCSPESPSLLLCNQSRCLLLFSYSIFEMDFCCFFFVWNISWYNIKPPHNWLTYVTFQRNYSLFFSR
jgi:hypothetical protein